MNEILIISAFLILIVSHIGVLLLGYKLGAQVNPEIYMSKPKKKGKQQPPEPSVYQRERLDLDYE